MPPGARKTQKAPQETDAECAQRVHDFLQVLISIGAEARDGRSAVVALFAPDAALLRNMDAKNAALIQSDLLSIVTLTGAPETEDERAIVLRQALAGLSSRNPRLFGSAARAAGTLGKDAKAAVPLLLGALQLAPPAPGDIIGGVYTVHPSTLYDAVRALGKIGSEAAVPRLTRIAAGQDALSDLLNGEARAALQKIQGG